MLKRLLVLYLLFPIAAPTALAAEQPKRIEPDVANRNLVKRVNPTVPPRAKTLQVGGTVTLDVTVSADGKVRSVKALSGPAMLVPACIQAVSKWEYKPFMQDGHGISAVTKVQMTVASPGRTESQENALQEYYPAFHTCYELIKAGKPADAEKTCSEAVVLSDELPTNRIIERSDSRTFLAHSFVGQGRPIDAVPLYEKALEIDRGVEDSERDADFASDHANLARAYFSIGKLDEANLYFDRSVAIYEAAIVALPGMRENYTARLNRTLLEYAKVKKARGEMANAQELERKAAELRTK